MRHWVIFAATILAAAGPERTRQLPDDEATIWVLTQKIGTVAAYEAFLARYPAAVRHSDAVEAYKRLGGQPIARTLPPALRPNPVTTLAATRDPCTALSIDAAMERTVSAEARAYDDVKRDNRLADYKTFVIQFPSGACTPEANRVIAQRSITIPPVAGWGPMPARRLTRNVITQDDYPAAARRAEESGTVSARWDVSEDGRIESCRITLSSGSRYLDEATCRLFTRRTRYNPARDAAGAVTRGQDGDRIIWQLSTDEESAKKAGQ